MKEYEASVYDVVTVLNINDSENFKLLELEEKEKYTVRYVFADGSCVLYKEKLLKNKQLEIYEYIIEEEDVKHLSLLYNYMDEENFIDECYDDEYNDDRDILLLDNHHMQYRWAEHDFEVGDFVYFKDVRVIKFYQEAELQNNTLYQITSLNKYNNCPIIKTNIGEIELYPKDLKHLYLYEGDVYGDMKDNLDIILEQLSNEVRQRNYDIAMDMALAENNIDKAQEIYNLHNNIK